MNENLKKENLKEIVRIGFITDEKKYYDFKFEIDYIKFKQKIYHMVDFYKTTISL